jgi:hypothetical protein
MGPRAHLDAVEERKFLTITELELRPFGRPARRRQDTRTKYTVVKKELYNGIPNVSLWRVLRKRLT